MTQIGLVSVVLSALMVVSLVIFGFLTKWVNDPIRTRSSLFLHLLSGKSTQMRLSTNIGITPIKYAPLQFPLVVIFQIS